MSKILIVSKTHMTDKSCIGALDLSNNKFLRLLDTNGNNQPKDTNFDIGDIWDISYSAKLSTTAPHNEDVIISSQSYISKQENMSSFIQSQNITIWRGDPTNLFGGCINFTEKGSGYISNASIPNQSVGFWIPDKNLIKNEYNEKIRYCYRITPNMYTGEKSLAYVGFSTAPDSIPSGTLIRVSLARWWSPDNVVERRCYLQLSGWY